ncbi:MAG: DUF262 domain-containing protein [Ignavibacteriales bacterium]|nr:hypothetical protein [Ignavibacteriaceae bacterium]MBW7873364.1 DUF262 domain-containing protein [Ignavibacteria bacterium]MBZ0197824.1 DUF262 domain-containing protein [Ignavibacteriaceae bacterium]MCZ2142054.1 DUF262 domain-containing protein [Ignavibacteriales bacterium]WKZ71754.1 MAG: DUF262 domain-containing protein [Ignavibacteriaceae bacterium]
MSELEQQNIEEQELTADEFTDEIEGEDEAIEIAQSAERKLYSQTQDIAIVDYRRMYHDRELIIQPEYQRNFVATPVIASKFIESVLMDVPIPVIYLAEEQDGIRSVIDGQQRLTSFLSFLDEKFPDNKEFKLTGLKVLSELNKKKFSQLTTEQQVKIKNTPIRSIIIKKESNEDIKFEIFERLNTGSIKLNEDELRNSVYRGEYIKLLNELSEDDTFHEIVSKDNFKKRMIYRGMILRFFALSQSTYLNYKPSMKQFCNRELRRNRHMSKEDATEYTRNFKHCIDLVNIIFGKNAFRRYIPPTEEGKSGYWATTRINMALFDIQMCGFANRKKSVILGKADYIREAMVDLMTNNADFIDAILIQTSNREKVTRRFKIWGDTLDRIIGDDTNHKRCFPYSVKKELFEQNPVCALSNQTILSIDDAEVDHIIPYSKGGPTTIENAQLVLRYFNRAKRDKYE